MKVIFAEARSKARITIPRNEISKLPKSVALATTVQFIGQIGSVKKELENAGIKVFVGKGKKTKYAGQVLGCDSSAAIGADTSAVLYIGTGFFHPIGIALQTEKPVFIFDPALGKIEALQQEKVDAVRKKRKGALLKFLNSEKIGILVSVKPGQNLLALALVIKKKLESQGKKAYVLAFDTVDFSELENFPFIECFLNLACPRISEDYERINKPVADYLDVKEFLEQP
jgi:2-(3-amino-3-carboxypropyl)histidine synthase